MAEPGYMGISRKMFDGFDALWAGNEPFDRRSAWIDLLQMAAYRPRRRMVGSTVVLLERGQLLASERFLGERWRWTRAKVRRFLGVLETDLSRIVRNSAHKAAHLGDIVTIRNYDSYNMSGEDERPTLRPAEQPGTAQEQPKIEEGKKETTTTTDVREVTQAMEDAASDIMRAANRGQGANPMLKAIPLQPILLSHGSRSDVIQWLMDGVPAALAVQTVEAVARSFEPQGRNRCISSMRYFDGAVRDAHEAQQSTGGESALSATGTDGPAVRRGAWSRNQPRKPMDAQGYTPTTEFEGFNG